MKHNFIFFTLLCCSFMALGQEEEWDLYTGNFEDGPGSVMIDMNLVHHAPIAPLGYVLVTGVKVQDCGKNGFPSSAEFEKLYQISDSVASAVDNQTNNRLVATFTQSCLRLDYFYVEDTTHIRGALKQVYQNYFPEYGHSIRLQADQDWSFYHSLYPNNEMQNYMANEKRIFYLQQSGDRLEIPRPVKYFLAFKEKDARRKFIEFARKENYNVDTRSKTDDNYPYPLIITHVSAISPEIINAITNQIRIRAIALQGTYTGWETKVITEKTSQNTKNQ